MSDEEKVHVRSKLMTTFTETDRKIAVQFAILVSMIARFDFPAAWPDLLNKLYEAASSGKTRLEQERALRTTWHVVHVLVSKRLIGARTQFIEIATKLFGFISSVWISTADILLAAYNANQADDPNLIPIADACKFSFKITTLLILKGIPDYYLHPEVVGFIIGIKAKLEHFLNCKDQPKTNALTRYFDKFIKLQSNFIIDIHSYPIQFVDLLPVYLPLFTECFFKYTNNIGSTTSDSSTFVNSCMNFMKAMIQCKDEDVFEQGSVEAAIANTDSVMLKAHYIITQFFDQGLIHRIVSTIISKVMLMSHDNLQEWQDNPEEFVKEEATISDDNIRTTAEALLQTLLSKYRTLVGPMLVQMVDEPLKKPVTDLQNVLLKDACYRAVGIGSYDLYDYLQFPQFFSSIVIHHLQSSDPTFNILKRRISWMIGEWTKSAPEMRPTFYNILVTFMSDVDLVVALTSCDALKILVDDCNFSADDFSQFVEPVVASVLKLLKRVEECDTKLRVISVINVLISQLGEKMTPHTNNIVIMLQETWQHAEPNESLDLLKQIIIRTFGELIEAVSGVNEPLYRAVIPMIGYATNVQCPDLLILLDDALSLWLAGIRNLNDITPFLPLFANIGPLVDYSFEHLRIIMGIVIEYLCIGKAQFLQAYVQHLVILFEKILGNVKDEPTLWTLELMELFVLLFPKQAPPYIFNVLSKIAMMAVQPDGNEMVAVSIFTVFAQILYSNPDAFFEFFGRMEMQQPRFLHAFLKIWLENSDNCSNLRLRKLTAVSLASLLPYRAMELSEFLEGIINTCIFVSNQEVHQRSMNREADIDFDQDDELMIRISGSVAKQAVLAADPITAIDTKQYLTAKLHETAVKFGDAFHQTLQREVDPMVMAHLSTLGNNHS
eukprot:TRINITY_DN6835_c0_g1_i1.p1 TRINITY_DN6835_c0_g1~~TRINITY_DN6835_c0_g1_i1.p1  ORF type:complete len:967 (-),score=260.69 TRINITY_DN6835_c0_g1_i1:40-2715(-)